MKLIRAVSILCLSFLLAVTTFGWTLIIQWSWPTIASNFRIFGWLFTAWIQGKIWIRIF